MICSAFRRPIACRRTVQAHAGRAAKRVKLGRSDLEVSECCLGTMSWGKQNTEAEAHEQMSYAWDQGINFLDAAEMYPVPTEADTQGLTERYIGTWLKSQKREDVVLASKVAGYSERIEWLREGGVTTRINKEQIQAAVDGSLERLGTDCIDLLQLHWPDRYVPLFGQAGYDMSQRREAVPFEEQLEGLKRVIEQGKVKYIGVSNETSYGVMSFIRLAEEAGLPRIQTIQNSYSLLVRSAWETDLSEVCLESDVSLLAYSPLASGTLSGKYITEEIDDKWRLNLFPGFMERYNESRARMATKEYLKVAEEEGIDAASMALAWCQSRPMTASSIIGATTMEQLKSNLKAFDVDLSDDCITAINDVHKRYKDPSTFS